MSGADHPEPPERHEIALNDPHRGLHERVWEAISAIPVYFRSETRISGVMATDLHTLIIDEVERLAGLD